MGRAPSSERQAAEALAEMAWLIGRACGRQFGVWRGRVVAVS
jgi:hypothetical protein